MKLFCVYDSAAMAFNDPFSLRHVNEAIRGFKQEMQNPQSLICKYPSDYTLYECGEFNNQSGEFTVFEAPRKVITGLDMQRQISSEQSEVNNNAVSE